MKYLKIWVLAPVLIIFFFPTSFPQFQLKNAFPNLSFNSPVDLQNADDGSDRIFIVERGGKIIVFDNDESANTKNDFLDITNKVPFTGGNDERGLLGLAFHPDYKINGYVYIYYTAINPLRSIVARYKVSDENPNLANPESELILLSVNQPYANHNGGQIAFGPDGYLYIALGDGGSFGDPQENGQKKSVLLGKILRIDADNIEEEKQYTIPDDNPFKGNSSGFKEEIFAYGLRNPWRFSFDAETGWLWCADVGQGNWEEINIIENGKNYGWDCYEGNHEYELTDCEETNYTNPIWEYDHDLGCSITGGFVYRGPNIPELNGKYIYGDYCSRRIWSLNYDGTNSPDNEFLLYCPASITSFGVDENEEIYITAFDDKIYTFAPTASVVAPSNLRITNNILGTNILIWKDNSDNEDGFKIERKDNLDNYNLIGSVLPNINTYIDLNILGSYAYSYRVYAYNSEDSSGYSNESFPVKATPVELISFNANLIEGNKVNLIWETATEINNLGFEIERTFVSKNPGEINWEKIGFIEGSGTDTQRNIYTFIDDFSNEQRNLKIKYRLKQIDFDGSITYSKEISIEVITIKKYELSQNYPNPFNPSTIIKYSIPEESRVKIEITNTLGEVVELFVNEISKEGFYEKEWKPVDLSSGVYYVRMNAESILSKTVFTYSIKMLYLK